MHVGVAGLWHLGSVTAAGLAAAGHTVLGYDPDDRVIQDLKQSRPPILEPGLNELIAQGLSRGNLSFSSKPSDLAAAELLWITYDTPVDSNDRADVEHVVAGVTSLFPLLRPGCLVLISSQLPVGSTARLEALYQAACAGGKIHFAYAPENLRLGKALEVFSRPDRVVIGVRRDEDRKLLESLFKPITDRIEWMSVESAEMTKHATNAFLASSVVFINEIGGLCEKLGADAAEVERGLKSDARIGPRAYLRAGAAFAGGTLARDLVFLEELGRTNARDTGMLSAVQASNEAHKNWPRLRLQECLGVLRGRKVCVLGLTYKPGTDTLRRSGAVELCLWLHAQGACVQACDPAVQALPDDLRSAILLQPSAEQALRGASAAVLATEWPAFRDLSPDNVVAWMEAPLILDAGRFLEGRLGHDARIRYCSVGRST